MHDGHMTTTSNDNGLCIICESNPAPGTGIDAICPACSRPATPWGDAPRYDAAPDRAARGDSQVGD